MTIQSGTEIIRQARQAGYAVGAFNTNNLEWTQSIFRAAEAKKAPILMAVSMGAAKYMGGYKVAADMIRNLDESMGINVPLAIHLDHGNEAAVREALAAGFTSVMFDGSDLPVEENLKVTKELVELAHQQGAAIESEVGSIGGEEDGVIGEGDIALVEDAVKMAEAGVDFVAAGIGNIHGIYPDNWRGLHLDHLQELSQAADQALNEQVPFVLHGASGVPDDQIQATIKMGVAKVNVNTEAQLAFHDATRAFILSDEDLVGKNYDPRKLLAPGLAAVQKAVEERIDVFGSANQA